MMFMNNKIIWLVLILSILIIFTPYLILAQGDEDEDIVTDEETAPEGGISLWQLILSSGLIGFVIIFLSIASLTLTFIYLFLYLREDAIIPSDLLNEIEGYIEEEQYEEIAEACTRSDSIFAQLLSQCSEKIEEGEEVEEVEEFIEKSIEEEALKLQQKISWLQLIGSVAPMLGLLGTVIGMIQAFSKIAVMEGAPKPKDLASGIYQALVTTCMGLIVAIFSISVYFFFKNKIVKLTMNLRDTLIEVLDRFKRAEA